MPRVNSHQWREIAWLFAVMAAVLLIFLDIDLGV